MSQGDGDPEQPSWNEDKQVSTPHLSVRVALVESEACVCS